MIVGWKQVRCNAVSTCTDNMAAVVNLVQPLLGFPIFDLTRETCVRTKVEERQSKW